MGELDGRVVLVSGVGPGMGSSIALTAAREGADVVLLARSADRLATVATQVEALGRRALAVPTDITDEAACTAALEATMATFGHLDGLVNNAFVQPPLQTIHDNSLDVWRDAFAVNVFGTVQITKAALPALRASSAGAIVFINSMSMRRIRADFGAYAATKAALLATAQTLAVEEGPHGTRVNSVVPGYIWEEKLQWWFGHQASERGVDRKVVYDEVAGENPLHHLPTPDEIAETVTFLLGARSAAVTGQALDVNAGHWLH